METTIKSKIVTTVETVETDNAYYEINVTRLNGAVTKVTVSVTVQTATTDADGTAVVSASNIGTVVWSQGNISIMSIPADSALPAYISDALEIIESVKAREE